MTARKLDKRQWSTFLNGVTRMLEGKRAEVEVASLRLGDQVEAEWLPLLGIAYDSKDDIVEVALEGLDHLIPSPREIYVDDDPLGLWTFEIVNADDVREIIRFRDPLALPAPARTSGLGPSRAAPYSSKASNLHLIVQLRERGRSTAPDRPASPA